MQPEKRHLYNFSAGPAMLPQPVIQRAQKELANWQGTGVSIMEIGHRTPVFQTLLQSLEEKLRHLIQIPPQYKILFLPGGAQAHFSFIPMNLTQDNKEVEYIISGIWSERAAKFAQRYANVNTITPFVTHDIPPMTTWEFNSKACYVYYCPNETINGIQFPHVPSTGKVPLIADATSSILSAPLDISKFGMVFASAQKNLGIAGITLVIIRDDLLDQAQAIVPEIFNYKYQVEQHSLANTIPTFPIYMMDLMVDWLVKEYGGLETVMESNQRKSNKLYAAIDNSEKFYSNNIPREFRSFINVPFGLPNESLLHQFLNEAQEVGLLYLNGHRLVGGARASLYNAMPEEGVDQLIAFMKSFSLRNKT